MDNILAQPKDAVGGGTEDTPRPLRSPGVLAYQINKFYLQVELWGINNKHIQTLITTDKPYLLVGSATTADIIVPAKDVAPMHALIRQEGERLCLYDLGSTTGIFYKGLKILEACVDKEGTFWLGTKYKLYAKLLERAA